jgi:hypothetical protein
MAAQLAQVQRKLAEVQRKLAEVRSFVFALVALDLA